MKFPIYCIKDELLGYGMPILRDNDAVASRAFEFDCNRENSPYKVHSDNYSLYHIGEYDTETAIIVSNEPRFIICASNFYEV